MSAVPPSGAATVDAATVVAVEQVLARYGHLADNRDLDRLDEVFTPEAVFEAASGTRLAGVAALAAAIGGGRGLDHATLGTVVARDPDGTVRSWSRYLAVDDEGAVASGEYLDTWAATPAGWRIAARRATRRRPAPPGGRPPARWYAPWRAEPAGAAEAPGPAPADPGPLVVGEPGTGAEELAAALGVALTPAPPAAVAPGGGWAWSWAEELEAGAAALAEGPRHRRVVVCTWGPVPATSVAELTPEAWLARVEAPLSRWFATIRSAADRCADGGAVVVVAERPAGLDSAGHGATTTVAEGLAALTRSVALIHGERGVRANLVATEVATAPDVPLGLAPPLASFPGTVAAEVAGAVRLLLSPDAAGITGTVVRADCGRSWT